MSEQQGRGTRRGFTEACAPRGQLKYVSIELRAGEFEALESRARELGASRRRAVYLALMKDLDLPARADG